MKIWPFLGLKFGTIPLGDGKKRVENAPETPFYIQISEYKFTLEFFGFGTAQE